MKRLNNYKIGPMPLLAYICCAIIVFVACYIEKLPSGMVGGFAILLIIGWLLWAIGDNIPFLKHYGASPILCLLIPSLIICLYGEVDQVKYVANASFGLMKGSNWLYFYISSLICGSILGMHKKVLIQGFLRMLPSLFIGSVIGIVLGILIGLLAGYHWQYSLFYIITPIMAGGVGEGVLPLSSGYDKLLGLGQEQILGYLMAGVIIGNFTAILFSAIVNRFGESHPKYSGKGQLVQVDPEFEKEILALEQKNIPVDLSAMACGVVLAGTMMAVGNVLEFLTGFPGAVLMIVATAVLKCIDIVPEFLEEGARHLYTFMSKYFTPALMTGLGFNFINLTDAATSLTWVSLLIIIVTVLSMSLTSFFIARKLGMHPVEASIVNACHSGMGGTGDVAILTTANRMNLMPFAQISTRLGGALTVLIVLSIMKWIIHSDGLAGIILPNALSM